jgi:RNase H-fold protein (predicted Holliday junction resolvase)
MDEIRSLCHEINASYLVLGRPQIGKGESIFSQEIFKQFTEQIEQKTGTRVLLPELDQP